MTKQEQIEDMAHIMCEYYNRGFCANGDMTEICEDMPDCCYKNYAEAVYDAGYRKVLFDIDNGYGNIKQAKIDVLNKLKKRARTSYVLDDFILGSVVFSKDIDELIKEIENEQNTSNDTARG